MENFIHLGYASRAVGLKGEIELKLFSGQETHLRKGHHLYINEKRYQVEKISLGPKIKAKLKEITNREQAEQIAKNDVYCEKSQLPKPEKGEVYLVDLIGLELQENGQKVGKVLGHYSNGAQEILQLNIRGEVFELPYVKKFFPSFNLEQGWLEVIIPEVIE